MRHPARPNIKRSAYRHLARLGGDASDSDDDYAMDIALSGHGPPERRRAAVPGHLMAGWGEPMPPVELPEVVRKAFAAWFRESFVKLRADLMRIGVKYEEAQDATAQAAEDLLRRWEKVEHPYAYARTAALRSVIKCRKRSSRDFQRGLLQESLAVSREDPGLTAWEDREWVMSLLDHLPPAQREVMACVVDQFTPAETALLLGRTPAATRRALADARKSLRKDLTVWRAEVMHLDHLQPGRSEEG